MDVLVEELGALHNKWRALGEALHLSEEDMEAISTQHSHTEDCLQVMLFNWLDTDVLPSWQKVLDALRKVGEDGVANKLKVKYGESATTVISLILLACDNMGNCGMELIIESVDSICRDSADTQYMLIQTNFSKSPKQLTYKPL